ncbi:hypothetical protein DPSP01_006222 [Paraphaeosphaeria sporulosa]
MSEPVRFRVPEPTIDPVTYSQGNWLLLYYFVLLCIAWIVFCKGKQMLCSRAASKKVFKDIEGRLMKHIDLREQRRRMLHLQSTLDAVEEMSEKLCRRIGDLEGHRRATQKTCANVEKRLRDQSSDNRKNLITFKKDIRGQFQAKLTREVDMIKRFSQIATKEQVKKAFDLAQDSINKVFEKNNANFTTKLEEQEQRGIDALGLHKSQNTTALQDALRKSNTDFATKIDQQEKRVVEKNKSQTAKALQERDNRDKELAAKQKYEFKSQFVEQEKRASDALAVHKSHTTTALKEQEDRLKEQTTKQKSDLEAFVQEQIKKGIQDGMAKQKSRITELQEQTATALQEQKKDFEFKLLKQKSEVEISLKENSKNDLQHALAKQKSEFSGQLEKQETRNKKALDAQASKIDQLGITVGTLDASKVITQKKVEEQERQVRALEVGLKAAQSEFQKVSSLETKLATHNKEIKVSNSTNSQLKTDVERLQNSTVIKEELEEQKKHRSGIQTELATMKTQISNLRKQQNDAVSEAKTDRDEFQEELDNDKKQAAEKIANLTKQFLEFKSNFQEQGTGQKMKTDLETLAKAQEAIQTQVNVKMEDLKKTILADFDAKISSVDTKISLVEADTKAVRLEQSEGDAKLSLHIENRIKVVQSQLDVLKGHPHPEASHHSTPQPISSQQRTPQHSGSPHNIHQQSGFPPNMIQPFVPQQNLYQQSGFQQNMFPQPIFQSPHPSVQHPQYRYPQ